MVDWISVLYEKLRTSLWPVPLAMLFLGVALYAALWSTETPASADRLSRNGLLYSGSGDDARNLLSTLVTAIITMSAVVFSITIVALTLAANQYGSRVVRIYTADIRTKLALGLFMMTVVYCLLALRSVHADMPAAEVPHLTVTGGLMLALICVLVLALFLNWIARSIMADEVIRRVANELKQNVRQLPPLHPGQGAENHHDVLPADFAERSAIVLSCKEGYVQAIEYDELVALASRRDIVIKLDFRAGVFLCKDSWLATVYPGEKVTPDLTRALQQSILIGAYRTPTQDLEFSTRHLVDVGLRALSPGINDANTALVVIDHLRGPLSLVFAKRIPSPVHRDESGAVRVVGRESGYAGILDAALHQIRQAAETHPAVIINLLNGIERMAEHVRLAEQHDALLKHAELAVAAGLRNVQEPRDRADIEEAFAAVEKKLRRALRGTREAGGATCAERALVSTIATRALANEKLAPGEH